MSGTHTFLCSSNFSISDFPMLLANPWDDVSSFHWLRPPTIWMSSHAGLDNTWDYVTHAPEWPPQLKKCILEERERERSNPECPFTGFAKSSSAYDIPLTQYSCDSLFYLFCISSFHPFSYIYEQGFQKGFLIFYWFNKETPLLLTNHDILRLVVFWRFYLVQYPHTWFTTRY